MIHLAEWVASLVFLVIFVPAIVTVLLYDLMSWWRNH